MTADGHETPTAPGERDGARGASELQVPKEIILASKTITKANANDYLKLGL